MGSAMLRGRRRRGVGAADGGGGGAVASSAGGSGAVRRPAAGGSGAVASAVGGSGAVASAAPVAASSSPGWRRGVRRRAPAAPWRPVPGRRRHRPPGEVALQLEPGLLDVVLGGPVGRRRRPAAGRDVSSVRREPRSPRRRRAERSPGSGGSGSWARRMRVPAYVSRPATASATKMPHSIPELVLYRPWPGRALLVEHPPDDQHARPRARRGDHGAVPAGDVEGLALGADEQQQQYPRGHEQDGGFDEREGPPAGERFAERAQARHAPGDHRLLIPGEKQGREQADCGETRQAPLGGQGPPDPGQPPGDRADAVDDRLQSRRVARRKRTLARAGPPVPPASPGRWGRSSRAALMPRLPPGHRGAA